MHLLLTLTRKELNHLFHSPLGYLYCALFPTTLTYFLFWQSSGTNIFLNGTSDLRVFFKLAPFFLAIFVPLLAMRAWSEEKRQGTMEWILASPLPDRTVVSAKFLAPFLAVLLTLCLTLSFSWTLEDLAELDWGTTLMGYFGLVLFSGVALSFSLWISSLTRHQILAFLVSFFIFSFFAFFENSPLNLNFRIQTMAQGLLALKDLVYFLSLICFFLVLNHQVLDHIRRSGVAPWLQFSNWIRISLIAVILFAVNMLASFSSLRWDVTEKNLFTLSPSTQSVLSQLDEEVHLKLFFSTELPPQFQPILSFIEQIADEYEAHSAGKLKVMRLHPDQDEKIRREAMSYGITETAGNVTEKARIELVKIWFGMALTQGERQVVFPTMQDIPNLEFDLTNALLKLNAPERKTILLAGPMPPSPLGHDANRDLAPLINDLQKQFEVEHLPVYPDQTVSFLGGDALIVWGVREFTEDQLRELDTFVHLGKPVLLFTSGVSVQIMELLARDLPEDQADAFFSHLGFSVGRNLVSDNSCQNIQTTTGSRVKTSYPLFPLLNPLLECFPGSFQPLASMNSLTLPWCSALEILDPDHIQVILQSSKQAWLQERFYELNPEKVPGPTTFERYPLGIWISGEGPSFFEKQGESRTRNAIAIGSHHVLGQYQNPSSLAFIANTLNFFCASVRMDDIARRENAFVPLPSDLSYEQKRMYQWINMLFGPLILSVLGAIIYLLRRKQPY